MLLSKFIPAVRIVSGEFRCLLITSANSLDPDQDQHNVGPDLDPNLLTLNSACERIFGKS